MTTPIVEYNVSDAAISKLKEKYDGLTAETPQGYKEVVLAIAETRTLRVAVEKTRVELKADALAYGRKVDTEAKRITAALMEIEEPLKLAKQAVDDEKERIRWEKEQEELRAREAEEAAKRAEEERIRAEAEAKRKAEEAAERERIRKEQEAENVRLQAEREALAKERAEQEEKARVEREKIDAERRAQEEKLAADRAALKAEQDRLDRERFERDAKERAEREARERTIREANEREAAIERANAEKRLRAERLPDKGKLLAFADEIASLKPPTIVSVWAKLILEDATNKLDDAVESLRSQTATEQAEKEELAAR